MFLSCPFPPVQQPLDIQITRGWVVVAELGIFYAIQSLPFLPQILVVVRHEEGTS